MNQTQSNQTIEEEIIGWIGKWTITCMYLRNRGTNLEIIGLIEHEIIDWIEQEIIGWIALEQEYSLPALEKPGKTPKSI